MSSTEEMLKAIKAGKRSPFGTAEAIIAHVETCRILLREDPNDKRVRRITHYLNAIDEYVRDLHTMVVALAPELYDSESKASDPVLPPNAQKRLRKVAINQGWIEETPNEPLP